VTEPPGPADNPDPVDGMHESRSERLGRTARQGAERAKVISADLAERSERARGHYRSVDTAFVAHQRDRRLAGGLLAGALAFRIFLLLLPLVLVFVAGFGLYSRNDAAGAPSAGQRMGLTAYTANIVDQATAESSTGTFVALGIGLVGIFFASRSTIKALRVIHALAWQLPIPRLKAGWKTVLVFSGVATGLWLFAAATGILRTAGPLGLLAALLLRTAFYAGLVAWMSATMPHPAETGFRDYLPGAVVAAVGLQAMQLFSEIYLVHKAQSFSALYGGLGVAAVLLLWLYLIGRLIVGAAMVNATRWERRQTEGPTQAAAD